MSKAQKRNLLRSGVIVSAMTMLSRILGLLRDVVLSRFIGAGSSADAFFIVFKIPNFLRRLFAEGAFAQAFVPVLSEYREKGGYEAVKALVDRVTGCLGLVLTLITVLAIVGSPILVTIFAPGFRGDAQQFELAQEMLRLTFPYLLLISLTGLAGAILNSYDRFAIPAVTPVFLNVCLIVSAIYLSPYFEVPAMALAWGVLVAGFVQLAFQLPFLGQLRLLPAPKVDWHYPGVKKILTLMGPAIFGVSVAQINLLLDSVIASFLQKGSISWLYFSDRLVELPLGVFGIAIATIILPNLSRQHTSSDNESFNGMLNWGLRLVMLIGIPAALALFILATPILSTLFLSERFDQGDVFMATASLRAYTLGLLAFMLVKVLAPGYFSRQDMKTPVRIGIIAMVANMGFNLAFVLPLHFIWNMGHVGLALATSVSSFLNAYLLYRGLRASGTFSPTKGWAKFVLQLLLANVAMAVCLLALMGFWSEWFEQARKISMIKLGVMCGSGAAVYLLVLALSGLRLGHLRHKSS